MIKMILMWILFIPIPVINGLLRDFWYKNKIGELGANIVGFFALSSIFIFYVYLFFGKNIQSFSIKKLIFMGVFWLLMTLIFEFSMGFLGGRSLEYILADYNIFKGRLWPLCLVAISISPFIVKFITK